MWHPIFSSSLFACKYSYPTPTRTHAHACIQAHGGVWDRGGKGGREGDRDAHTTLTKRERHSLRIALGQSVESFADKWSRCIRTSQTRFSFSWLPIHGSSLSLCFQTHLKSWSLHKTQLYVFSYQISSGWRAPLHPGSRSPLRWHSRWVISF